MADNSSLWSGLGGMNEGDPNYYRRQMSELMLQQLAPRQPGFNFQGPGAGFAWAMNRAGDSINSALYRAMALQEQEKLLKGQEQAAGPLPAGSTVGGSTPQPPNKGGTVISPNAPVGTGAVPKGFGNTPPIPPEGMKSKVKPLITGSLPPNTGQPTKPNIGQPTQSPDGLTPTSGVDENGLFNSTDVDIGHNINPNAPYMSRDRDMSGIKRMVFHYDGANTDNLLKYGQRIDRQRGFDPNYHFYIDPDAKITQGVPLNKTANHALRDNADSVGIVYTGVGRDQQPTVGQSAAGLRLARELHNTFGITQDQVFGHGELANSKDRRSATEGYPTPKDIRENGFGEPDVTPSPLENQPEQNFNKGRMMLGVGAPGAQPQQGPGAGIQLAQNAPARPGIQAGSPINPTVQGQNPPVPRAESQEEFQRMYSAILRAQGPEEAQKYLDTYRKRLEPYEFQGPGTTNTVAPIQGGGGEISSRAAAKGEPFSVGAIHGTVNYGVNKQGQSSYTFVAPGQPSQSFDSISDLWNYKMNMEAKEKNLFTRTTERATNFEDMYERTVSAAQSAPDVLNRISLAKKMVEDPSFYSGVGAEHILDFKKVVSALGGHDVTNLSQSEAMEVFKKLTASTIMEELPTFKGLGQIRNAEIQLLQQATQGLTNRPEAIRALLNISERIHKRMVDVGSQAQDYFEDNNGLDAGWNRQMLKYRTENPLFKDSEIQNYKELFKSQEQKQKEIDQGAQANAIEKQEQRYRTYIPGVGWKQKQIPKEPNPNPTVPPFGQGFKNR